MRLRSYQVVLSRRTAKSVISLLMIVVLLLWLVVYPITTAKALGLITVAGTVTMTLAVLASIVMITMGASGMDGAVRNQAAATGTEPLTYMGQLLNRFAASGGGMIPSTFASILQAGMTYLPDGTLIFNSEATEAIADFQRWAWDEDGANLEQFAVIGTSDGNLHGGGFTAYSVNCNLGPVHFVNAQTTDWYYSNFEIFGNSRESNYLMVTGQSGRAYVMIREATASRPSATVWAYVPTTHSKVSFATSLYTPGLVNGGQPFNWSVTGSWQQLITFSLSDYPNHLPVQSGSGTLPDISDMIGDSSVIGDVDTFVGPMQQGKGTEIPLGDVVSLSPQAAANLHLANYLRAVAAAYAGTGTVDVPVTDVGTGDEDVLPLSVPLDTPLTVTAVTDSSIDQSGSIAGSDSVAGDFAGTDDFTMDLTQFFPFCVPFDLYAILSKFDAAAEAPVIDWVFDFGDLGQYPLQLDFSPFDTVAAILRDLETVAFAVGLILLTKRLIQGGD